MKITNTAELRAFLLERMVKLVSGEEPLSKSQAAAALAKQVNATLAIELQAVRLLQSAAAPKPLDMIG